MGCWLKEGRKLGDSGDSQWSFKPFVFMLPHWWTRYCSIEYLLTKCFFAQLITSSWGRQEACVVFQKRGRIRSKFSSLGIWCLETSWSIFSDSGWCSIYCNHIHQGFQALYPNQSWGLKGVLRIHWWKDIKIQWFLPEYLPSPGEGKWLEHCPQSHMGVTQTRN